MVPSSDESQEPPTEKGYHVAFVNVLQTACLLQNYYELFKNALGENFMPLKEAMAIESPESSLWKLLFPENADNYHLQRGLLLECALDDAQVFHWKHEKNLDRILIHTFFDEIPQYAIDSPDKHFYKTHPFSADNFLIPPFVTFSLLSEQRDKYYVEKGRIMDFYKGKDFAEITVDILTGSFQPDF